MTRNLGSRGGREGLEVESGRRRRGGEVVVVMETTRDTDLGALEAGKATGAEARGVTRGGHQAQGDATTTTTTMTEDHRTEEAGTTEGMGTREGLYRFIDCQGRQFTS